MDVLLWLGYTILLVLVFMVAHHRALEHHNKNSKTLETLFRKLQVENETLKERLEERNNTIDFLKRRLDEVELPGMGSIEPGPGRRAA